MPLLWLLVLALQGRTRLTDTELVYGAVLLGALPAFFVSLSGVQGDMESFFVTLLTLGAAGVALLWSLALTAEGNARGVLLAALAALLLPPLWGVPGLALLGLVPLALLLGHARQGEAYHLDNLALRRSLWPMWPLALLPLLGGLALLWRPDAAALAVSTPPVPSLPWANVSEAMSAILANVFRALGALFSSNENAPPLTPEQRVVADRLLNFSLMTAAFLAAVLGLVLWRSLTASGERGLRRYAPLWSALGLMALTAAAFAAVYFSGVLAFLDDMLTAIFRWLREGGAGRPGSTDPGSVAAWNRVIGFFVSVLTVAQPLAWLTLTALLVYLARVVFRAAGGSGVGWLWGEHAGTRRVATPLPHERVRLAYLAAGRAASEVGLGRRNTETPAEWAARLRLSLPSGEALSELTALYESVRYGQGSDAACAERAEAASEAVQNDLGQRERGPEPWGTGPTRTGQSR